MHNYAFPFSASSTTTWRGPRVLPFQALQHSCHFSKGCSLHPLVYVYSGVPNLEMCFLLTLSESKSYHSHILFLNSCSTAFGQAYILHCDSWIQILSALSCKWNLHFSLLFCVMLFKREMGGNGKRFLTDDILKFKVYHAVFPAPQFRTDSCRFSLQFSI